MNDTLELQTPASSADHTAHCPRCGRWMGPDSALVLYDDAGRCLDPEPRCGRCLVASRRRVVVGRGQLRLGGLA